MHRPSVLLIASDTLAVRALELLALRGVAAEVRVIEPKKVEEMAVRYELAMPDINLLLARDDGGEDCLESTWQGDATVTPCRYADADLEPIRGDPGGSLAGA